MHETVHHFRQELIGRGQDTHHKPIVRHRCVKRVAVDALLFDLRGKQNDFAALRDPEIYTYTQQVGRAVYDGRHPGILVNSARRVSGENVDVFNPAYLSTPRDCCYLTYRYDISGEVQVEREPGRVWLTL